MPGRIQRVPRGLLEVLSINGGETPVELEDRIGGVLDMLQFYGLQQRRVVAASNAAAAEGTFVSVIPSTTAWCILFGASVTIVKTATMTALRGNVAVQYNNDVNQRATLAEDEMGPFGATETGAATIPWRAPFPLVIPPNTAVGGNPTIIGTDATAFVIVGADVGMLG